MTESAYSINPYILTDIHSPTFGMSDHIRHDFNRIATLPEQRWNSNKHYYREILNHIGSAQRILEVGTGKGGLARLMAETSQEVTGVDLSENMIAATNDPGPASDTCSKKLQTGGGSDSPGRIIRRASVLACLNFSILLCNNSQSNLYDNLRCQTSLVSQWRCS